jgi:hypothetical protein
VATPSGLAIEQTVPLEMRMVVEIIMATHAGMTSA